MVEPMRNQEFYDDVDRLCMHLHEIGIDAEANRIGYLLHKVAWTSTSELFGALETAFRDLLSGVNAGKLPQHTKEEINGYILILTSL